MRSSWSRASAGSSSSTSCPSPSGEVVHPKTAERRFGEELQHVRDSLTAWQLRVPQLRADWDDLERAFSQSISGPRRVAHPREGERAGRRGPAARGRHAVVHDGVRPRLDRHGDPDDAARAGAGAERPRGARRATGDRGRPGASTPSRGRSSTRCGAARRPSPGSRATTARSTRRRSISCCSPRSGAGPTTRGS